MVSKNGIVKRKLTSQQLATLLALYQFRFMTVQSLAQHEGKSSTMSAYNRLSILESNGYVIRRYDSSFKLKGKPAYYYLSLEGLALIKKQYDVDLRYFKTLYNNRTTSLEFIEHCILVHRLKLQINEPMNLFGRSDYYSYENIPPIMPDLILQRSDSVAMYYVVDRYKDDFVVVKNIRSIIDYFDENPAAGVIRCVLVYEDSQLRMKNEVVIDRVKASIYTGIELVLMNFE